MTVILDTRALVKPIDVRRRMRSKDLSIDRDDEIRDAINDSSALIRRHCGRRFLFLGTDYVEFHDVWHGESILYLREKPIISITSVEEDSQRNYGAGSVLTAGDDYLLDKNRGTLTRVSGADVWRWETGARSVRVTYQGGYNDVAGDKVNIVNDLKRACIKQCLLILREDDREMQGVSSVTDTVGSVTKFDARTAIHPDVLGILVNYRVRHEPTWITNEVVA